MPEYLAVLHAYINADDYISAIGSADDLKIGMEQRLLDTDQGEAVDVVQTIPTEEPPTPSAQLTQLRRARNILLRTKSKDGYDLARALDLKIHELHVRLDPEMSLVSYDWSKFIEVLKEVTNGGNPLDY